MWGLRKAVIFVLLVAGALCLQACGPQPGEEETVRAIFEQIRNGQFDEVESRLSKRTPETRSTLERLRNEIIPEEPPDSVRRLNWSFEQSTSTDVRTVTSVDEYAYQGLILIVTTTLKMKSASDYSIDYFYIKGITPEEAQVNDFTLKGKPPGQLAFLGALIASIAVMAFAVLRVLRAKSFKRKWLWVIVSLLGAPVFVMNWTTGEWAFQFMLGLIGAGVTRSLSPIEPWIVQFQFPIGALVSLWRVSRHRRRLASTGVMQAPPGDMEKDVRQR
jgi:hypothetical protein